MKTLLAIATALVGASTMAVTNIEDFERLTAGDFNPVTAWDVGGNVSRWETTGDQTGTIVAYGATDDAEELPEAFDGGNKYLHVDSGSDTLLRHSVEPTTGYVNPDLGVYVDCWTQFTAADELDSLGNTDNDKLRVYLYKDANEALSFHVVAGYLAEESDIPTATDYAVTCEDVTPAEGTWYHLTIKSIADIVGDESNIPGFVIFINGKPAVNTQSKGIAASSIGKVTGAAKAYNEAGQLFPSLVAFSASNATKLVGIGFRGTGNVDNISFTDKETFEANNSYAQDPEAEYALTVVVDGGTATGADTFENAFAAISGTPESVLITMNASLALPAAGVSPAYALTIDLNGKNLTGSVIVQSGAVTIKNTAATASSIVGSADDMIMNVGALTIGTGDIVVEETIWQMGGSLTLLSGKYKVKPTATGEDEAEFTNPEGKTLVAGTGADAGYYVLGDAGGSEGTVITDDDGSRFTVPPTLVIKDAEPTDTVPGKGYNYAQAYALGLYDTTTGTVTKDPVVTIAIVNGVVTVNFEAGTIPDAYSVSYEVYGSTTLKGRTEAGWTKIGNTAAYGTAVEDTVGDDDAKFYMVKVAIIDKK